MVFKELGINGPIQLTFKHVTSENVTCPADIALTFQEVNSVNFSGLSSRNLPQSLSKESTNIRRMRRSTLKHANVRL